MAPVTWLYDESHHLGFLDIEEATAEGFIVFKLEVD